MEKKIDIFIGGQANPTISSAYYEVALELGAKIQKREDYNMIFDGCQGLPYIVYKSLNNPLRVSIWKTVHYRSNVIQETGATVRIFQSQSEFIYNIPRLSDAMIFLKGGPSTVTEIMSIIDSKKNQEHDKPIVILNINNEWQELIQLLNTFRLENIYYVAENVTDALNYIESELFKSTSSFFRLYSQYIDRTDPIIESARNKK